MKYYEALGIAPALALDAVELKKRFLEQSREHHPDRFARASAADQQNALDMTALVNDAYRTLKDPVSRADYFLESSGIPPSKAAPPELLEEVFELNMALEELRSGDDSARPQLTAARDRFQGMLQDAGDELQALFTKYDASRDGAVLKQIRGVLDRRRYISNLVRDVEKELVPAEPLS